MAGIEGRHQIIDQVDDDLARRQRRRRAPIATLLRGRSEAAKLDDNVRKVEVFLRLPRRLAQSAHAASPLAVDRSSSQYGISVPISYSIKSVG